MTVTYLSVTDVCVCIKWPFATLRRAKHADDQPAATHSIPQSKSEFSRRRKTINLLNDTLDIAGAVNIWPTAELIEPETHGEPTNNHHC